MVYCLCSCRMACFERVSVFLTQENLLAQIRRHYTMQVKKKTIWWWQILDKLFLLVIHIMLITSSHIVCCWLHVFFQANLLSLCFASLSFSCFNKYLGLAYILPSRSKREYCHGTGHHVSYLTCKNSVINNLKCHFFAKQTWWQLSRCINFLEISNLS